MADARDDDEVVVVPARVIREGAVVVRAATFERFADIQRRTEEAEVTARALVAAAEADAEALREEAREEGRAQGRREAAAELVVARAAAARLRAEAAPRVIRLAVELAGRVLHSEIATAPEVVADLAARCLAQASWAERATLRVHPDDAEVVQEAWPRLAAALDEAAELALEVDDTLARGACLVETPSGVIDGSLSTQLADLEARLLADLKGDAP